MAERLLDAQDAAALGGTTDPDTGLPFPTPYADPWLVPFYRFADHLRAVAQLANALRVYPDDASDTTVGVRPGAASLAGARVTYPGGTLDLATANNDLALLWAYDAGGEIGVSFAVDSVGWPDTPHVRLAEVTLDAGRITDITDRRAFALFADHAADARVTDAGDLQLRAVTQLDRPLPGIPGRIVFNSTTQRLNVDTGSAWTETDGAPA